MICVENENIEQRLVLRDSSMLPLYTYSINLLLQVHVTKHILQLSSDGHLFTSRALVLECNKIPNLILELFFFSFSLLFVFLSVFAQVFYTMVRVWPLSDDMDRDEVLHGWSYVCNIFWLWERMLTRNNNVEALRLLLEDVNAQSGEYGSALQAVSSRPCQYRGYVAPSRAVV